MITFRGMVQAMASSMNDVKYMGYRWGDWIRQTCGGLGYSSETSISRLTTSPGRSERLNYSPDYEPDPVARRFDTAWMQIQPRLQQLLYFRFVEQLSDRRLMGLGYKTEGQSRCAVEKAIREIGRVL